MQVSAVYRGCSSILVYTDQFTMALAVFDQCCYHEVLNQNYLMQIIFYISEVSQLKKF